MSNILRLSLSKTKTFIDCRAKYNFSYNLKLPKKERDYHIFGKFTHKVLEDFHRAYIDGSMEPYNKIMAKSFKTALLEYKSKMTKEAQKEAYDIIDRYLEKISTEKKSGVNIIAVEKNFDFHISDNVVLNGMIDRVQVDPDGILNVCDYKTVKNKKYLKNDFLQLLTYAYVLWSENPTIEKIRGSYILLRHDFEYIVKDFTKAEIMGIKNKYEDYAKMIEEERLWRPAPSPLCRYCDFLEHCEEGLAFANKNVKYGEIGW